MVGILYAILKTGVFIRNHASVKFQMANIAIDKRICEKTALPFPCKKRIFILTKLTSRHEITAEKKIGLINSNT